MGIFEGLGLIPSTDLQPDGVHPNQNGYDIISLSLSDAGSFALGPNHLGNLTHPDPVVPSAYPSVTVIGHWRSDVVAATSSAGLVVTKWFDLSGNGHDLAATGAPTFVPNQPVQSANSLGNRSSTLMSGGQLLSAAFACPTPFTWVLVWKSNVLGAPGVNDVLLSGFSTADTLQFRVDNTPEETLFNGSTLVGPTLANYLYMHCAILVVDGASSVINVDGVETTGNIGTAITDALGISIGAAADGSRPANGWYSEAWALAGAMSAADRAAFSQAQISYYSTYPFF
jgi:hypothetical protein